MIHSVDVMSVPKGSVGVIFPGTRSEVSHHRLIAPSLAYPNPLSLPPNPPAAKFTTPSIAELGIKAGSGGRRGGRGEGGGGRKEGGRGEEEKVGSHHQSQQHSCFISMRQSGQKNCGLTATPRKPGDVWGDGGAGRWGG